MGLKLPVICVVHFFGWVHPNIEGRRPSRQAEQLGWVTQGAESSGGTFSDQRMR